MGIRWGIILFAFSLALPAHTGWSLEKSYAQISSQQFNRLLPGKTIKGEYRYLRERTQTFNFKEAHYADGTTLYTEGKMRERGQWYTLGDYKICYKYPSSPLLSGTHCFWVYKSERCYYGYSISSMSYRGVPRNYDDWSARWIIEGDGGSCDVPVG